MLARQHGVIARRQLRALGLGKGAIEGRVAKGSLIRVERGVYSAGHGRLTERGRWMAAVLASGRGAVLSHLSAGALWALVPSSSRIHVTVATARRGRRGVAVHRSTQLPFTDITRRHGIPTTRPARTLLDLAEVLPRRALERTLDEAERLCLCTERLLRDTIASHPGRIGSARLTAVLDQHELGTTATVNDFEELFLSICDDHGLPRPRCQVPLLGYRADFLWEQERLVVETDGRGTHMTISAFESDRVRDNELGSADWAVRRFTWRQLNERPGWVAATVAAALSRPGAARGNGGESRRVST